mmetsp:Transcript_5869/g.9536  ORF Transcript_5869/g.9536 Transcript_5869/m.9536 type:complete len:125 (-) Transcript_5869:99-473(-)
MGAGASTTDSNDREVEAGAENETDVVDDLKENKKWSQVESLPEKITHEQATEVFGEEVSRKLMRSFSIDGSMIDKNSTMKMVTESVDNEVYNLFMNYTTDSLMNEESFLNMMRDCRILSKQDLR